MHKYVRKCEARPYGAVIAKAVCIAFLKLIERILLVIECYHVVSTSMNRISSQVAKSRNFIRKDVSVELHDNIHEF